MGTRSPGCTAGGLRAGSRTDGRSGGGTCLGGWRPLGRCWMGGVFPGSTAPSRSGPAGRRMVQQAIGAGRRHRQTSSGPRSASRSSRTSSRAIAYRARARGSAASATPVVLQTRGTVVDRQSKMAPCYGARSTAVQCPQARRAAVSCRTIACRSILGPSAARCGQIDRCGGRPGCTDGEDGGLLKRVERPY